jgi:CRISPR system Cascade subunit CasE
MNAVHLVRARLHTPAMLRFSRDAGVDARDPGYLAHLLLRRAFGEFAPQPFLLEESGSAPLLWGYSRADAEVLRERLAFADPLAAAAFLPEGLESRPMPLPMNAGRRLGFRLRACPVVRRHREDGRVLELDAFLARTLGRPKDEPVVREEVYREWLRRQLAGAGAGLLGARLVRFLQVPLVRRTGGGPPRLLPSAARDAKLARRPDATFEGVLEVRDPGSFAARLARGIGRHRAFGYGMLLLRPAE